MPEQILPHIIFHMNRNQRPSGMYNIGKPEAGTIEQKQNPNHLKDTLYIFLWQFHVQDMPDQDGKHQVQRRRQNRKK